MQTAQDAQQQLKKLVRQLQDDSRREADQLRSARERAEQEGASKVEQALAQLRAVGLDQEALVDPSTTAEQVQAREQLSARLAGASLAKSPDAAALQLDDGFTAALAPETVKAIPAINSTMFSAAPRNADLEQAPQA